MSQLINQSVIKQLADGPVNQSVSQKKLWLIVCDDVKYLMSNLFCRLTVDRLENEKKELLHQIQVLRHQVNSDAGGPNDIVSHMGRHEGNIMAPMLCFLIIIHFYSINESVMHQAM